MSCIFYSLVCRAQGMLPCNLSGAPSAPSFFDARLGTRPDPTLHPRVPNSPDMEFISPFDIWSPVVVVRRCFFFRSS